jgi:hypothetical protein
MPLLPGSPAIDAGTGTGAPATDQRGVGRVGAVDIGAFESRGFRLAVTGGNNQQALVSTAFGAPLRVQVTSGYGEPVQGGVITFSAPASGAGASLSPPLPLNAAGQTSVSATANGTAGGYAVSATARGATTQSFSLTNLAPVALSPATLPDGTYGTAYSQTLTATGGVGGPYTYAVTNVAFPAGLSLTTLSTGVAISGTPTTTGSFSFTVTATDSAGYTGSHDYSLTIDRAALTVTANDVTIIQGEALPAFTVRYSGFVNGDGPGVLDGTLTVGSPFTAGSPPGTYSITPAGQTSGNYAITFAAGTLTVLSYGQAVGRLQALVDTAGLAKGVQSSLDSQLQAAIAYFAAGDTRDGVSQLQSFVSHVSAQSGKQIAFGLANAWVAYAQEIINAVP